MATFAPRLDASCDAGYLDKVDYLTLKADRRSVPGGSLPLLLLVEHLHEANDRLLIQTRGRGCGQETVVAESATQPGERPNVSCRGYAHSMSG